MSYRNHSRLQLKEIVASEIVLGADDNIRQYERPEMSRPVRLTR